MCVCGVSSSPPSFHLLVASAETFVMGKIHKEIAMFMLEASEDGSRSEQSFVKVQLAPCTTHCVETTSTLLALPL